MHWGDFAATKSGDSVVYLQIFLTCPSNWRNVGCSWFWIWVRILSRGEHKVSAVLTVNKHLLRICRAFRLPETIAHCISLTHLGLNDVSLTQLPADIGQLANLRSLEARDNLIRTLPASITLLKNLQVVDLGQNELDQLVSRILSTSFTLFGNTVQRSFGCRGERSLLGVFSCGFRFP